MQKAEGRKKIISLQLTKLDVTIMLEALGAKQIACYDARIPSKSVDILIERIYRALGVRMDKP